MARMSVLLLAGAILILTPVNLVAEPTYLLTYDHIGQILWGPKRYADKLHSAVSLLERYPAFKIGEDNEDYTYDAFDEDNPALLPANPATSALCPLSFSFCVLC